MSMRALVFAASLVLSVSPAFPQDESAAKESTYGQVHQIFVKSCIGCHNAEEKKGDLVLETYESLMKGGESGSPIVAGKSNESLLVAAIEHQKKPFMPPPKKAPRLPAEEVAKIRAWIDAGALPPAAAEVAVQTVPRIEPKGAPRRAIQAMAYEPRSKLLALARAREVELRSAEHREVVRSLQDHAGNVNDLVFSSDGSFLAAAGGEPGVSGEVVLWNVADGKRIRVLKGHKDAIYAVAVTSDGRILATGSYDQKILLWDIQTGKTLGRLDGHNEAVFDLAFRPDGKILASAGADRTVKLWDVAARERRDTLVESTKALHAVAFSPDGSEVAAGGVDNRIRIWRIGPEGREGTNSLRVSQFVHEGTILKAAYSSDGKTLLTSADDRTVKLWNAADVTPRRALATQPDWPSALAFVLDDKAVAVGRLDGGFSVYDAATGKEMTSPRPEVLSLEHRGLERGTSAKVKLKGKHLVRLTGVKVNLPKVQGELLESAENDAETAWINLTAAADAPPGAYEVSLVGAHGESLPQKVQVENLRQIAEIEPNDASSSAMEIGLPVSLWGTLGKPGDMDYFAFEAKAGQTIVLDAAARRIGSGADVVLTVLDASGKALAAGTEFNGESDSLIVVPIPADGRYTVRVNDLQAGSSPNHFYRLTLGALPLVTGFFPLSVPANAETEVRLIGPNLPAGTSVKVKAEAAGELSLPIDPILYRTRRDLKLIVSSDPETLEAEPNGLPEEAPRIRVPGAVNGCIGTPEPKRDVDLFRFDAKAGQDWVIETAAAQRGSPVDTRIEVLHADGRPVERLLLRAIRDSYITFSPLTPELPSTRLAHGQEMELNQYLYLQGEVTKLFRAPRGPDSDWIFYSQGNRRLCYFDTSPTAHALDESCYIVEPHPIGTKLSPNGLPTFTLFYANDDDARRERGSDSRLHFTAPADGAYLVRVTDARGFGGDRHVYRLVVREAKPDFDVTLEGVDPAVMPGSGRAFTVVLKRKDGFDGPVRVEITGAPAGFTVSTPLLVEAGHLQAMGTLHAAADAPPLDPNCASSIKLTATATIGGKTVTKEPVSLGKITLGEKPKISVRLEPFREEGMSARPGAGTEISVIPGQRVSALLHIERNGHDEAVTFEVENLPHGVIVADIGLNGVLIPEGQTERRIFLVCEPWVAPADRLCYARAREGDNPTSRPGLLHVVDPRAKKP